ncbi:M48 family metallopeptidase [Robertkochia solimangrovi]|uniref:M48 family metallopeptidase n=1 Tax=Robertkochia solimangrovi TaxID=2213046 RepID=UPI001180E21F|nr:M48 family metallopeptidase [Robertkochia solimangrovi]TRZ46175.1 peptidase M48 [Robertkochia solimangrovi]
MNKVFIQGIISISSFFIVWLLLSAVSWTEIFSVEENRNATEVRLGKMMIDDIRDKYEIEEEQFVVRSVDSLVYELCRVNHIDSASVKVYVVKTSEVNAYALPDGNLVINSGLIARVEQEDELAGVICHELGHIQLNHVMHKLIKEMGLSVIVGLTTGGAGNDVLVQSGKILSSSAFDRTMEKEADLTAVTYLTEAEISPEGLANFLYKLADYPGNGNILKSWVSTHPELKERAEYIINSMNDEVKHTKQILDPATFSELKRRVTGQLEE